MKVMSILFALALYLPFVESVAAQPATQCPKVSTSGPSIELPAGSSITYSVNVSGGDPKAFPTYNWTVSAGAISSGQATPVITIEDTKSLGGMTVTATVEVGGFPRECLTSDSWTVSIKKKQVPSIEIDEYSILDWKIEQARLDKIGQRLKQDPTALVYVIFYDAHGGKAGDAEKASLKAFNYLEKTPTLSGRIFTGLGGLRDAVMLEYFFAVAGADPPMATPTLPPAASKTPKTPGKP